MKIRRILEASCQDLIRNLTSPTRSGFLIIRNGLDFEVISSVKENQNRVKDKAEREFFKPLGAMKDS